MKGKDLKQATVFKVVLDKERPFTFDFNTLSELQEIGYDDPYQILTALDERNLKAVKSMMYAGLKSGQAAEDETIEFDLSLNKIGQMIGSYMHFDVDGYLKLFDVIGKSITDFFPKSEKNNEESESDSKN